MADRTPARAFYSRWAGAYDLLASHAPGVARLRRRTVDALDLSPGDTVVDVGCGTGATLPYLREAVGPTGTVVGVDFAAGTLSRARRRTRGLANVHVVRGDARELPVDRTDAVVASFVVGMLDDPAAVVADWCDIVEPGGRVGLLDLARSTGAGRPLNPLFAALVRLSSPPGTATEGDATPAHVLDCRVAAAHQALLSRAAGAVETAFGGFVRRSVGRVDRG